MRLRLRRGRQSAERRRAEAQARARGGDGTSGVGQVGIERFAIVNYRHSIVLPDFAGGGDLQAVSIFLRTPSTPTRSNVAGGVAPEPSCTRTPRWAESDMRPRSRPASPRKVAAFPPVDVSHRSCTSCWLLMR